eukprot:3746177-Amphidinium_carterae.1
MMFLCVQSLSCRVIATKSDTVKWCLCNVAKYCCLSKSPEVSKHSFRAASSCTAATSTSLDTSRETSALTTKPKNQGAIPAQTKLLSTQQ